MKALDSNRPNLHRYFLSFVLKKQKQKRIFFRTKQYFVLKRTNSNLFYLLSDFTGSGLDIANNVNAFVKHSYLGKPATATLLTSGKFHPLNVKNQILLNFNTFKPRRFYSTPPLPLPPTLKGATLKNTNEPTLKPSGSLASSANASTSTSIVPN